MKKSLSSIKDFFKKPKDIQNATLTPNLECNRGTNNTSIHHCTAEVLIESSNETTISSTLKDLTISEEIVASKTFDESDPALSNNLFAITKKVY